MRTPTLIIASLFLSLSIHNGLASGRKTNQQDGTSILYGKASFYYGKWIGRKTANGEIYRRADMTAAHKTLPFNTRLRVTNLRNGRTVTVRVNNRGPYIKGRIIDLSLAAAEEIGMVKAGVVPVKAEVLSGNKK